MWPCLRTLALPLQLLLPPQQKSCMKPCTWSPIPIPVQWSKVHGPLFLYLYRGVRYMVPYSYTCTEEYGTHGPLFLYLYRGVWYMVPYSYTCTEEYGTWSPIPIPVQRSMVHGPLILYLYRGVWYMVPYCYTCTKEQCFPWGQFQTGCLMNINYLVMKINTFMNIN